jgi:hypothetical protein
MNYPICGCTRQVIFATLLATLTFCVVYIFGRTLAATVTAISIGFLIGLFFATFTTAKHQYAYLFQWYTHKLDTVAHIPELLHTYNSPLLYGLANFALIGLFWGFMLGLLLGIFFSLLFAAAGIVETSGHTLNPISLQTWRRSPKKYGIYVLLIGFWSGVLAPSVLPGVILTVRLGIVVGALAGGFITFPFGIWLAKHLKRAIYSTLEALYDTVVPPLHKTWKPLLGFMLGYLVIVYLFAAILASAHLADPEGIGKFTYAPTLASGIQTEALTSQSDVSADVDEIGAQPPDLDFWNFLYFSIMTITSLGYSDIQPDSPLTQNLAAWEGVAAVVWTVIIFAVLSARLYSSQEQQNTEESPLRSPEALAEPATGRAEVDKRRLVKESYPLEQEQQRLVRAPTRSAEWL